MSYLHASTDRHMDGDVIQRLTACEHKLILCEDEIRLLKERVAVLEVENARLAELKNCRTCEFGAAENGSVSSTTNGICMPKDDAGALKDASTVNVLSTKVRTHTDKPSV